MRSLLARHEHGTERRAHAGRAISLGQFHARKHQARNNLTRVGHNRILRLVHVQCRHARNLRQHAHACEALDRVRTHRTIVAAARDNHAGLDHIGVHARLCAMVQRHQRPVGHNAGNTLAASHGCIRTHNQVLSSRGIEQLDVRHRQHLGHQRRCHQRSMLHHHIITIILIRHLQLVQQLMRRLADDHSGEELAAQPGAAAGRDALLNQGNLGVRTQLAKLIGTRKAS
mmetsp:Transcript_10051/g.30314  ORF Transcript_10051/g.30314 Transcript_10051/m.30314 type:complete len:228 (+) Transcript_10051:293-976(+)